MPLQAAHGFWLRVGVRVNAGRGLWARPRAAGGGGVGVGGRKEIDKCARNLTFVAAGSKVSVPEAHPNAAGGRGTHLARRGRWVRWGAMGSSLRARPWECQSRVCLTEMPRQIRNRGRGFRFALLITCFDQKIRKIRLACKRITLPSQPPEWQAMLPKVWTRERGHSPKIDQSGLVES